MNDVHDEINGKVYSGYDCYSAPNCLSSHLHYKTQKIKIYKTIILPDVLCGHEMWHLTFIEEHKFQVFGNKVIRRLFRPKKYEVSEQFMILYNEELSVYTRNLVLLG